MKKNILIIGFCAIIFQLAIANPLPKDKISRFTFLEKQLGADLMLEDCDVCGCSASGGSLGFSSMLNNNFVGVRYFYQSYTSKYGIFANSPWIDENFNTTQIWAKIPLTENIQITALVPYQSHERQLTAGTESINGLGDITVMASYTVYRTQIDSAAFYNQVQLGGGLKLPTGKFNEANNSGMVNQGFQLGTGSLDFLLLAEHQVNWKNWGLNNMMNYNIKTENSKNYLFGNQFNYGSTLFYLFQSPTMTYVPQIGVSGELYDKNVQLGQVVSDTGGDVFFGKLGFEIGRNKFNFGANVMLPINQHLSNEKMQSNYRLSLNLNYTL